MGVVCRHFTEAEAKEVIKYLDSIGKEYTVRRLKSANCYKLPISIHVEMPVEEQLALQEVYAQIRERLR